MYMKQAIKLLFSFFNRLFCNIRPNIEVIRGFFIDIRIKISTGNIFFSSGDVISCRFVIDGKDCSLYNHGRLSNSECRILGNNCSVIIEDECGIRNSIIIVRGNNCHIKIGKGTTVGSMYMVCMGNANSITIGEGCMLADNVEIWATDSHAILDLQGNLLNPSKPVKIGNHVWIGKQAAIMKGVSIGDNAIVGMRSLVTNNIASGTLNVGSPSRCIRENINWDRSFITKYEASDEYSY